MPQEGTTGRHLVTDLQVLVIPVIVGRTKSLAVTDVVWVSDVIWITDLSCICAVSCCISAVSCCTSEVHSYTETWIIQIVLLLTTDVKLGFGCSFTDVFIHKLCQFIDNFQSISARPNIGCHLARCIRVWLLLEQLRCVYFSNFLDFLNLQLYRDSKSVQGECLQISSVHQVWGLTSLLL